MFPFGIGEVRALAAALIAAAVAVSVRVWTAGFTALLVGALTLGVVYLALVIAFGVTDAADFWATTMKQRVESGMGSRFSVSLIHRREYRGWEGSWTAEQRVTPRIRGDSEILPQPSQNCSEIFARLPNSTRYRIRASSFLSSAVDWRRLFAGVRP